jgi:hypothetical protein
LLGGLPLRLYNEASRTDRSRSDHPSGGFGTGLYMDSSVKHKVFRGKNTGIAETGAYPVIFGLFLLS